MLQTVRRGEPPAIILETVRNINRFHNPRAVGGSLLETKGLSGQDNHLRGMSDNQL
jgi:hypothetical protein